MRDIVILLLLGVFMWNCGGEQKASQVEFNTNYQKDMANPERFHQTMKQLTDIIVHDIFSPPVASRIYAYPSIAAYEAIVHDHPEYQTLADQLTDLDPLPQPKVDEEYCFPLASLQAFMLTAKTFIFSEDKMEKYQSILMQVE